MRLVLTYGDELLEQQGDEILQYISELTRANGLPEYFDLVSVAAYNNLKYGIPKDFP